MAIEASVVGNKFKLIKVKLIDVEIRNQIMKEKVKLKALSGNPVYIDPDMTPRDQEIYNEIKKTWWRWDYTSDRLVEPSQTQQQVISNNTTPPHSNSHPKK